MIRSRSSLLLFMFTLALALPQAAGMDGDLDATFAQGGKFLLPKSLGLYASAVAVKSQPDGKVLVAIDRPYFDDSGAVSSRGAILRLTKRGQVDRKFADHGLYRIADAYPREPAVLDDGRIVFLTRGDDGVHLVALHSDGTLDESFAGRGKLRLFDAGGLTVAVSKILVSGTMFGSTTTTSVVRYDSDGDIDTTFGTAGVATIPNSHPYDGSAELALNGRGEILVGLDAYGESLTGQSPPPAGIAKLSASGQPVTEFGQGGVVTVPVFGAIHFGITDLSVASNGTVAAVASGRNFGRGGPNEEPHVFDGNGKPINLPADMTYVHDLEPRPDSSFVVSGWTLRGFTSDFTLNPDFDASGTESALAGYCDYWTALDANAEGKTLGLSSEAGDCEDYTAGDYVMRMLGPDGGKAAPQVQITSPEYWWFIRKGRRQKLLDWIRGTAQPADRIEKVELALQRIDTSLLKRRSRCRWVSRSGSSTTLRKATHGKCTKPYFMHASGIAKWKFEVVGSLPVGKYRLYVRATMEDGSTNPLTREPDSYREFRVKKF